MAHRVGTYDPYGREDEHQEAFVEPSMTAIKARQQQQVPQQQQSQQPVQQQQQGQYGYSRVGSGVGAAAAAGGGGIGGDTQSSQQRSYEASPPRKELGTGAYGTSRQAPSQVSQAQGASSQSVPYQQQGSGQSGEYRASGGTTAGTGPSFQASSQFPSFEAPFVTGAGAYRSPSYGSTKSHMGASYDNGSGSGGGQRQQSQGSYGAEQVIDKGYYAGGQQGSDKDKGYYPSGSHSSGGSGGASSQPLQSQQSGGYSSLPAYGSGTYGGYGTSGDRDRVASYGTSGTGSSASGGYRSEKPLKYSNEPHEYRVTGGGSYTVGGIQSLPSFTPVVETSRAYERGYNSQRYQPPAHATSSDRYGGYGGYHGYTGGYTGYNRRAPLASSSSGSSSYVGPYYYDEHASDTLQHHYDDSHQYRSRRHSLPPSQRYGEYSYQPHHLRFG
jgi:hypothetical protein